MDMNIFLLVASAFVQHTVAMAFFTTSFRATVDMVSGDSRVFTGESFRLKCSVPGVQVSKWTHQWFKDSERLRHTEETLFFWKARVTDSGKYSCRGVRDSVMGEIQTLKSLPVEMNVDGGWAILQGPPHPGLVGESVSLMCRVRGEPPLQELILYKDNVEFMKQKGPNPHFYLNNLTLEERGMYSCRASWDIHKRTRSVVSVGTPVRVLESLSKPVLEIDANYSQTSDYMKLICHAEYNIPTPTPPINYYFYKNNFRLGTSTSENYKRVKQTPGLYSCNARVPQLGLSRWSEAKHFGQEIRP